MPSVLEPLAQRHLMREDVHRRLRDAITDGRLAPGSRLRDGELAGWLGVSRTPVREALLRLQQAGLVVSEPQRATYVSDLDLGRVAHARSVVSAMHELAVREGVARLSSEDRERMRGANDRFARALEDRDVEAALAADDELHAVPVAAAGNTVVETVLEQFTPLLRRLERRRFSSLAGRQSVALHATMIELCAAGDVDGAARASWASWQTLAPLLDDPSAEERP